MTVKARVLDEYREYCGTNYVVHLLVQIARNPDNQLGNVQITTAYPFTPRVFVPGMAQIHKGSTGKGVGFIVGEILLVGGIVTCEELRASYAVKINTTHNAAEKKQYIDDASNMETARNIFIAGAATLYVWNIIDGCTAKGKKHIRVMPYASQKYQGVTLSWNF